MRCPKCHYISFDSGDRCRNCGYDFSLAADASSASIDVTPQADEPSALSDFSLEVDRDDRPGSRQPADKNWPPADAGAGLDLPLFSGDDRPKVRPPAVPRPPLAVRRATPVVARVRTPPPEPPERALPLEPEAVPPFMRSSAPAAGSVAMAGPAPAGRRIGSAVIDVVLLAGLDLAVLYLTLRLAGLGRHELQLLPLVPFAAFLALLDGGYLMLFTAAVGQTIGKMAFGIRVVDAAAEGDGLPRFGQAAARALGCGLSLATLGLGYLPALVGDDRRALHDRLARTRVVCAPR